MYIFFKSIRRVQPQLIESTHKKTQHITLNPINVREEKKLVIIEFFLWDSTFNNVRCGV